MRIIYQKLSTVVVFSRFKCEALFLQHSSYFSHCPQRFAVALRFLFVDICREKGQPSSTSINCTVFSALSNLNVQTNQRNWWWKIIYNHGKTERNGKFWKRRRKDFERQRCFWRYDRKKSVSITYIGEAFNSDERCHERVQGLGTYCLILLRHPPIGQSQKKSNFGLLGSYWESIVSSCWSPWTGLPLNQKILIEESGVQHSWNNQVSEDYRKAVYRRMVVLKRKIKIF